LLASSPGCLCATSGVSNICIISARGW
jgi:hypothetical protein